MRLLTVSLIVVALGVGAAAACAPAVDSRSSTSPRGSGGEQAAAPLSFAKLPKIGMRATCPVMKHAFTIKKGAQYSVHQGRFYVFCCPGCKPKFEANPAKYIKPAS